MIEDMDKTMNELLTLLRATAQTAIEGMVRAKSTPLGTATPQERLEITTAMSTTVSNGLRAGRACVEILERLHRGDLTPEQTFLAADILEAMQANLTLSTAEMLERERREFGHE
jgi:hypothetical protein